MEDKSYIPKFVLCYLNCSNEETNKYSYEDKCVIGCPVNAPFQYSMYNLCSQICLSTDFFLENCKIYNNDMNTREKFIQ